MGVRTEEKTGNETKHYLYEIFETSRSKELSHTITEEIENNGMTTLEKKQ